MSPIRPVNPSPAICVPRASGDEPSTEMSPLVRTQVFPARAGMSPQPFGTIAYVNSVPRASGDEPTIGRSDLDTVMCSPRERG